MFHHIVLVGQLASLVAALANPLAAGAEADGLLRRATTSCAADNCARAVYGTTSAVKPPRSSRLSDCASFFSTTVTPLTTTTVTTYTSTETDISSTTSTSTEVIPATATSTSTTYLANQQRRQVVTSTVTSTPTSVPAYASACSGTVRYSSACSCAGVTRTTVTAPTSTITVTVSGVTTTSTATTSTTTTSTTATVATTTVLVAPVFRGPSCNAPGTGPGNGGCSSDCTCDSRPQSNSIGLCDADNAPCSSPSCNSDADCPDGHACGGTSSVNQCGHNICFNYAGCSSTYTPSKRSLLRSLAFDMGSMHDVAELENRAVAQSAKEWLVNGGS